MDAERPLRVAYRFERFTLDLARGTLLASDGAERPLRPKSFALLQLLVENAGRLLDRDTIMRAVWPDVFVTDDLLTHCVGDIRRALGDEAQRLLRTVPRRGYLFAAEVSPVESEADNVPVLAPLLSTPANRAVHLSGEPSAEPIAGAAMQSEVERRLRAVVAADVVGYTRHMEEDEAGTVKRVEHLHHGLIDTLAIPRGGRVVNTAGDGFILEFSSAVEAIAFAADLQTSLAEQAAKDTRPLVMRVGVNIGDVIIREDSVVGDAVNVAARLEGAAEPGGVLVSDAAFDLARGRVPTAFAPVGPLHLKNISRPVEAWHWHPAGRPYIRRDLLPGSAHPRPTVAVLPFDNFTGDERWQRIADGIAEEIITDLARHDEIAVIARHSTFALKAKSLDHRAVRQALGAGYILEGGLQATAGRVRLTVPLVDAEVGTHLWAACLEQAEDELFELEDSVVEAVAGALCGMHGAVARAEIRRVARRHPASLEAFDLYLLGHLGEASFTRDGTYEAINLLQRSIALDPNYARAWLVLGYCWEPVHVCHWQADTAQANRERRRAISTAAQIDSNDPLIMIEFGDILFDDSNHAAACSTYERALAASRTNADALALISKYVAGLLGRPTEAREIMDRALRLNPYAPPWYHMNKLRVCYLGGDYAAALEAAHRSPETPVTRLFEGLSLAGLGRTADAASAMAELRRLLMHFLPVRSTSCRERV
jgi:adenylate cyclase